MPRPPKNVPHREEIETALLSAGTAFERGEICASLGVPARDVRHVISYLLQRRKLAPIGVLLYTAGGEL